MSDTRPPEFIDLLDWLEGRLNAEEAAAMDTAATHFDEATTRTVAWITQFLQLSTDYRGADLLLEMCASDETSTTSARVRT